VDLVVVGVDEPIPRTAQLIVIRAGSVDDLRLLELPLLWSVPALAEEFDGLHVGGGRAVAEDRQHEAVLEEVAHLRPLAIDEAVIGVVLMLHRVQKRARLERLAAAAARSTEQGPSFGEPHRNRRERCREGDGAVAGSTPPTPQDGCVTAEGMGPS
jgi:hypothetical protein